MSIEARGLKGLAARAVQGDFPAAAALRREIEPHMQRIVRRALRPQAGADALTQRIRAAARRVQGEVGWKDSHELAAHVVHRLCESVFDRLHPRPLAVKETVQNF